MFLPTATSTTVTDAMKQTFSRHGAPEELVSDNGLQYRSYQFKKFMTEWNVQHTTSSPRYPQSNGFAESMVKNVKRMIKKCIRSKQDINMGLLILRNSPLNCGASPAQLLMGRQLKDNLPKFHMHQPSKPKRNLVVERNSSRNQHDARKVKKFEHTDGFVPGATVALQHHSSKEWSLKGRVVKKVAPRSYEVQVDGSGILRRNQQQIRKLYALLALSGATLLESKGSLRPALPSVPLRSEHIASEDVAETNENNNTSETEEIWDNTESDVRSETSDGDSESVASNSTMCTEQEVDEW